jgi:hypothetical protein
MSCLNAFHYQASNEKIIVLQWKCVWANENASPFGHMVFAKAISFAC